MCSRPKMFWVLELQTGGLAFQAEPFSSEVLLLDAALCHSHSQYTLLSISIITSPRGFGEKLEKCSVCVNVAAFVPKKAREGMCTCVWDFQPSAVFSERHPTVCYLSKLKAPVVYCVASGKERNNWAITLLPLSSQRCSASPCLAFYPGGLCSGLLFPSQALKILFIYVSISRSNFLCLSQLMM